MKYNKINVDLLNKFTVIKIDSLNKPNKKNTRVDKSKLNREIKRGDICEGERYISGKYSGNGLSAFFELSNNMNGKYIMSSPIDSFRIVKK